MKKHFFALLLAFVLLSATAVSVNAAAVDLAPSAEPVGTEAAGTDDAPADSEAEPSALPSAYSSLDAGFITPVRSQNYNTCWAYSSTAVMEALLNKRGQGVGQLSPMDMNYRMVTQEDGTGWQRTFYASGYPYIALGYLTAFGAVKDEDVPDSISEEDFNEIRDSVTPYAYAESVIYLGGDTDAVKNAVYTYGGAVGNFHYSASMMNESTSAYYCDIDYITTANLFGHAVAIVGWDDAFDRESFNEEHRPEHNGAWLCKNSWGEWWGSSNGYFWISYEDKHLFDSRFGPSYAISGVTLNADDFRLKQNEIYGATYEFNYLDNAADTITSLTYANVLDFTDGFNVIDKVTFESTAVGSGYDIFYIPADENGVPRADEASWVLLYSGTISDKGYICADVADYAAPVGKGAIGVRITRTDDSSSVAIGVDEWLSASSKSIFVPDAKRGDSYLLGWSDSAYDLMDFYHEQLDDEIGGTFVIKTQTLRGILGDVDGDGEVTILDATGIQRYLAGIIDFGKVQKTVADYDRDGDITILDCTRIQRMLVGFYD